MPSSVKSIVQLFIPTFIYHLILFDILITGPLERRDPILISDINTLNFACVWQALLLLESFQLAIALLKLVSACLDLYSSVILSYYLLQFFVHSNVHDLYSFHVNDKVESVSGLMCVFLIIDDSAIEN